MSEHIICAGHDPISATARKRVQQSLHQIDADLTLTYTTRPDQTGGWRQSWWISAPASWRSGGFGHKIAAVQAALDQYVA